MLLRERVYNRIKNDILSGVYRMGDKLPVDKLAEEYQVSKTPVREALNTLQNEGLVEIVPRVGYFVAHMTVKEVQDLFELRLILEGASAEMAARSITEDELQYLGNMRCAYVSGDIDSYWQYLKDNREFHYRVALATGNERLAEAVGNVLDQMQGLLLLEAHLYDRADQFTDEHRQLVAALRKRDGKLARKVMTEAIENTRRLMLEAIMSGANLPIRVKTSARR